MKQLMTKESHEPLADVVKVKTLQWLSCYLPLSIIKNIREINNLLNNSCTAKFQTEYTYYKTCKFYVTVAILLQYSSIILSWYPLCWQHPTEVQYLWRLTRHSVLEYSGNITDSTSRNNQIICMCMYVVVRNKCVWIQRVLFLHLSWSSTPMGFSVSLCNKNVLKKSPIF